MDKTATESTGRTSEPDLQRPKLHFLSLLIECDRPEAGSLSVSLDRVAKVLIGRGEKRLITESSAQGSRSITLTLPDKRVSGSHAVLERDDAGWSLRDLGSANGTRVGGQKETARRLVEGDVIQVGHSLLSFEHKRLEAKVPLTVGTRTKVTTFSPAYATKLNQLARIAMTPIPVLLLGESGTGKEVLAQLTHELSGRPGAFVPVNCGAIPPNLVESHLFGHQKGSFSGAVRDEIGFVRAADGGTLFLDEIGDLPPASQAALLRVLQEGEVHPVGAARAVRVDVRVIAATHRPLDRMQDEGSFRRDLYARLSGFSVLVPPLRERKEDLGQLTAELLEKAGAKVRLRPEAASLMFAHDWPLNVRELSQCLATATALTTDGVIRVEHLPQGISLLEHESGAKITTQPPPEGGRQAKPAPLSSEDEALRADLVARLEQHGGNLSAVARDMGKARQQIQRWVRRFGLKSSDD